MDRNAFEYLARRMGGYNRNDGENNPNMNAEYRRRRREDGRFMRGNTNEQVEIEYTPNGERPTDNRRYGRTNAHKGPDDDSRRRIGFGQGEAKGKSHWSEEEFVGDMEESLYHEVDDIFHYVEIMEKVYDKGYDELASAFYEIACEKFICAEFLKHQLKKTGHYNASEHKELEEDLEEARKMFKHAK